MDGEESKPNCLKINCTRFRIKQHTVKVVYMFFKKRKIWESIHNKWFENSIFDFHTLWQWLSNKSLICYIWTRCVLYPWWPCSYKGRWCHLSKSSLAKDSSVITFFFMCKRGTLPWNAMRWKESKANLENRSQCFNSTKYPEVIQDIISDRR